MTSFFERCCGFSARRRPAEGGDRVLSASSWPWCGTVSAPRGRPNAGGGGGRGTFIHARDGRALNRDGGDGAPTEPDKDSSSAGIAREPCPFPGDDRERKEGGEE